MRIYGAIILLIFSALTFLGLEPFSATQSHKLPPGTQRGPGGGFFWHGGYSGGK